VIRLRAWHTIASSKKQARREPHAEDRYCVCHHILTAPGVASPYAPDNRSLLEYRVCAETGELHKQRACHPIPPIPQREQCVKSASQAGLYHLHENCFVFVKI